MLIVYSAFSEGVSEGLWHQVPPSALAAALITTGLVSKWLGSDRAGRLTIVYCSSKKSLSQGITMAKVIFASHAVGAAILPLMLFYQIHDGLRGAGPAVGPSCGALREIPPAALKKAPLYRGFGFSR